MERTDLDAIEDKLNKVYKKAIGFNQIPEALDAIRGLMQIAEMRDGAPTRGVGFGDED